MSRRLITFPARTSRLEGGDPQAVPVHRFKSHGNPIHRHRTVYYSQPRYRRRRCHRRKSLMDNNLSNHDLRMFYTNERRLFSLLVQVHHIDPTVAVFIIALWLFLEHSGRPDVIINILSNDDTNWLRLVAMEAESIVEHVRNPRAPFTTGLELTAGLTRTKIVIDDFAERRAEIVEFMNGVVAGGLRRAFADIHMLPDHALRYLTELVPMSQQQQGTSGTNSSKGMGIGSGSGLFSIARGRGLFPWGTTLSETVPTTRRRSRSPGRQAGASSASLLMSSLLDRLGIWAGQGGVTEIAPIPTHGSVRPLRPIHTSTYDQEAGGSYQPPRSMVRTEGEHLPLQPLHPSVIQPPSMAFYNYWDPVLGWVVLPVGAGINMLSPLYMPHGVLPVPLQGMGLLPVPEEYLGYAKGGREGQQSFTRHQRMEQEGMESEDTWSGEEEEEEQRQQEQSSDCSLTQAGGGRVRTLFVTFSRGFPIQPEVLMDHFTNEYGDIVERVVSERTRDGEEPVYARIILKSPACVDLVLQGQQKLPMKVQGRDAWVRPYVTRRKKPSSKARQNRRRQAGKDQAGTSEGLKGARASSSSTEKSIREAGFM